MGNEFIKISLLVDALKIKKWYKEYLVVRFIASLRVSSTGSQFLEFFSFLFKFITGCTGSLLLCAGFLSLWRVGASL